MRNKSILARYRLVLVAALLGAAAGPARAADISTRSFANCNFPDTGQTASYTATFGEDHDYQTTAARPSYTIHNPVGISSVTVDNRTGLMWITNPGTDAGMGGTYNWTAALTACEGLSYAGYTDWRLPNMRELESLVDYGPAAPSINTTAFPGTQSSNYWSSTTDAQSTNTAWCVDFNDGSGSPGNKVNAKYVRCVRAGP